MSRLVSGIRGLNMDTFQLAQLLNTVIVDGSTTQVTLRDSNYLVNAYGTNFSINEVTNAVTGTATRIEVMSQVTGANFTLSSISVPLTQVLVWIGQNATETFWSTQLAGADTIMGFGSENELMRGYAGDDVIIGLTGADTLSGGLGNDTIYGNVASGGNVDINNYLRGDEGNDSIIGSHDFDDINGNMGADTCMGGGGSDWVVGGKDNDLLYGETPGEQFVNPGDDIVYGNLGDDTCYGGVGNDLIRGGQENDVLFGESGNDWMSDDRGNDTMTGGIGADTFHSFSGAGIDRVLDFNPGEDRIQLDAGTTYTVRVQGSDTIVDMGAGDQVILVGVTSTLPAGSIFIV